MNALTIQGESNCQTLAAGSKFTLDRHFSDNGVYVLTSVQHSASHPMGTEANMESFTYENSFTCLPRPSPTVRPR